MGVSYAEYPSALVKASDHGIWKAGNRCPDVILSRGASNESTRLYSEVTYGKFLVLFVGNHAESAFEYSSVAVPCIISRKLEIENGTSDEPVANQEKSLRFNADWVSPDDSYVVVVRPDMYIGYVSTGDHWRAYLEDIFA